MFRSFWGLSSPSPVINPHPLSRHSTILSISKPLNLLPCLMFVSLALLLYKLASERVCTSLLLLYYSRKMSIEPRLGDRATMCFQHSNKHSQARQ